MLPSGERASRVLSGSLKYSNGEPVLNHTVPGVPLGLAALAIAQMGIHLVFFLHVTSGPDSTNNVLALAFGVLIVALVIAGSLWIMTNLNANMMPSPELMNMHATPTGHY